MVPSHATTRTLGEAPATVAGVVLGPGIAVPQDRLQFTFVSSSGPGGQNVNKRATKCQLRVRLGDLGLNDRQTHRLSDQARGLITTDSELVLSCDVNKSQERNKAEVLDRLREIVLKAIVEPKRRIATKISKGAKRRRVEDKKARSAIKQRRSNAED